MYCIYNMEWSALLYASGRPKIVRGTHSLVKYFMILSLDRLDVSMSLARIRGSSDTVLNARDLKIHALRQL